MKQRSKILVLIVLIFISGFSLQAQDFGVILDQTLDFNSHGSKFTDIKLDYSGILIPRFSIFLNDDMEIIASAGLNYQIDPFVFIPELLRTDFTMRFGMAELKVGRMPYRDLLGLIAEGLFDGAHFSYETSLGTVSAGAWYTGLLYKKRANITMTDDELQHLYAPLNYDDFTNSYFAPKRMLASLGWENSAIGGFMNVQAAVLAQFDLSGADLNTQYFAAKLALPFTSFSFDIGGCLELIEYQDEFSMAIAAEAGFTWFPSSSFEQLISLRGRFSSGVVEDSSIGAFLPLTAIAQGNLLKPGLTGLSVISLDYIARVNQNLAVNAATSCFLRSDLGSYSDYPLINVDSNGYFMGTEFYGRLIWSVSSELQLNLGLGAFLPFLGDAAPMADALWRAELNAVFMLY